jgi:hypothetical protein
MWAETLIQRRAAGIRQQNQSAAADALSSAKGHHGGAVGGSPYRERDTMTRLGGRTLLSRRSSRTRTESRHRHRKRRRASIAAANSDATAGLPAPRRGDHEATVSRFSSPMSRTDLAHGGHADDRGVLSNACTAFLRGVFPRRRAPERAISDRGYPIASDRTFAALRLCNTAPQPWHPGRAGFM